MLSVLYEDNHLLVVNKQAGDIVQGDKTGDTPLSEHGKAYLKEKYNKPGNVFLGVVHRLDRPTSGIVLFARTSKALARLNEMLKQRTIKKTYWAVVKNCPEPNQGSLVHHLKKNAKQNKSYPVKEGTPGSKKAILHYKVIKHSKEYFLLEIELETGRHHQIRAQLAAIGCPIKGDVKYGFKRPNKDASIHLHARQVTFTHPVKKEPMTLLAPPPKDALWGAFV